MRANQPELFDGDGGVPHEEAWKKVLFATFHDILPGTCVRSAYGAIYDDLGGVRSWARERIETAIRRKNREFPPAPEQRLIFDNPALVDYDGYFECEPWFGYTWADPDLAAARYEFRDENGAYVSAQRIGHEAAMTMSRYALQLQIPAGGRRILTVHRVGTEKGGTVDSPETFHGITYRAMVYDDPHDTWTHGQPGYPATGGTAFSPLHKYSGETGIIFRETVEELATPDGTLRIRTRDFRRADLRELLLRLFWGGERKLLKLEFKLPFVPVKRRDGIPGGILERPLDGREYPVRDFVSLSDSSGRTFALIGDFTSADVQPDGTLRAMLLRSPVYLHHDPFVVPERHLYPVTGQGEHEPRFRLLMTENFDPERIAKEANAIRQGLWFSEVTLGCGAPEEKQR